jgi:hypothetical protein
MGEAFLVTQLLYHQSNQLPELYKPRRFHQETSLFPPARKRYVHYKTRRFSSGRMS